MGRVFIFFFYFQHLKFYSVQFSLSENQNIFFRWPFQTFY
jgi:hypothetical protein